MACRHSNQASACSGDQCAGTTSAGGVVCAVDAADAADAVEVAEGAEGAEGADAADGLLIRRPCAGARVLPWPSAVLRGPRLPSAGRTCHRYARVRHDASACRRARRPRSRWRRPRPIRRIVVISVIFCRQRRLTRSNSMSPRLEQDSLPTSSMSRRSGAASCCRRRPSAESLSSAARSLSICRAVVNSAVWPCSTARWPMLAATIDLPPPRWV
jgi:hypothetical protein